MITGNDCRPRYPDELRSAAAVGTTQVWIKVSEAGGLADAGIARSSGFDGLDRATLAALAGCRFVAGTLDSFRVESMLQMAFEWRTGDRAPGRWVTPCRPEYPAASVRAEEQGTTVVNLWIGEDGFADRAEIAQSSGWPRLDEAALTALRICQLNRIGVRAASVPTSPVRIQYVWRLEGSPPREPAKSPAPPAADPYLPRF